MIITKRKILTVLCVLIIAIQQVFIGYLMLRDDEGEKRPGIFIPLIEGQPKPSISSYQFFKRGATMSVNYWTARNNAGKEVLHIEAPFEAWEINKRIK